MDFGALSHLLKDLFVLDIGLLELLAEKIIRTVVVYFLLVFLLRIAGRRELAQMNSFDLVTLLLLANAVQNAIIGPDDSLVGGMLGGVILVALNIGVDRYLYGHPQVERRLVGSPTLLLKDGKLLHHHLKRERITEEELLSMIHRQGVDGFGACSRVILETSGVITVLEREPSKDEMADRDIIDRLDRIERLLTSAQDGDAPTS